MNVVDSGAWLEYFADGPNASFFSGAVEATLWTQDADFKGLAGVRYRKARR